ncbi:tubulin-specific chaperone c [Lophiotrema nucula]|uniref:Tubulin-specific chaperone c n=1 Tax=Lophiotrema nucula TaxID=690887 RepID=A0A6A5ZSJ3_9PLEO|nr:tubulin-specific chaperone c [Lophiotrema nucula]
MAGEATVSSPQSEAGLKERFFRYFQHEVTALQEQMERLKTIGHGGGERNDAVDHCLAGIERLSHEVKDASSYVPAYDQRTYGEAIKALSEKLQTIRNSFDPPKKFQFKTARKNPSAISLSDAAELAQQSKLRVPGYASDTSNATSSFAPTPLEKLSVNISNHSNVHIMLPTSASHATSSGTVSNLRRSVVDLSPPTANGAPFASLTLKNIKDSLVVCGHLAGPAHITGVENSVIVTSCRQFRMHASKNVHVYLYCSSRPIIEDCERIRFAPLPEMYSLPEMAATTNQWDQIDDFKWLKLEPSPHFDLLPLENRVQEKVWKEVVPGGHSVSLDDILKATAVLH